MAPDADFTRTVICEDPRIRTVQGLLRPETCAELIEMARPHLVPAKVRVGADENALVGEGRTNSAHWLPAGPLVDFVQSRISAATGLPVLAMEPPQVLRYEVGQTFRPHYDFVPPENAARAGQRLLTALVYISDDFDGGETDFPRLDIRLRGGVGDAIYFANIDREGKLDARTLHAGLAPTRGEKWLLSQWVRDRVRRPSPPR